MLTTAVQQDVISLFEEVIDAYISTASDSVELEIVGGDNSTEDEIYDEPEYKYEMSRINTKAEEWKKELLEILNGNQG